LAERRYRELKHVFAVQEEAACMIASGIVAKPKKAEATDSTEAIPRQRCTIGR